MVNKSVHTTIPEKYHNYVTNKGLNFSQLLMKAIENEMHHDPKILQKEMDELEETYKNQKKQILDNLEIAKAHKKIKDEKKKELAQGMRIV